MTPQEIDILESEDAAAVESRFQEALLALEHNNPDSAIRELLDLARLLPNDPAVWFNMGRAYDSAGQLIEAERAYRQALLESPMSPAIWLALGEIRLRENAYAEAEFCLRKAHILKPESIEILLSLGGALASQFKSDDAFNCCQEILKIKPDCHTAIYNMAFLQLRSGDYLAGFANFEARLAIENSKIDPRTYQQPLWDGSRLDGKSILIYGEQGMGDVIQFARYIPLVAEQGGKVVLEIDPPLIPLFESFPGIHQIIPKTVIPPLTDVYIQSLSLPYIFGTTVASVPNRVPYILPKSDKVAAWRQRLADVEGKRIGLVWRGNPKNPVDKDRSCPLSVFSSLALISGATFFSLQVGAGIDELSLHSDEITLIDHTREFIDFSDTAAFIANLDLVIGVDTAVTHLVGAMGKPVWIMLPYLYDWRWIVGRNDSVWYPTARVFWQQSQGDWDSAIAQVSTAFAQWLNVNDIDIEASYQRGVELKEAGDLKGAEGYFRQIVEYDPALPDPHHSLGVVLQLQNKMQEAIKHFRKAITLDPAFVKAHYNLANALLTCGLYQEALESVRAVLHLDPEHANSHWLLGMLLLQAGDFLNGWKEYEWRWRATEFKTRFPDLGVPQWDGSPLAGRTLLVHMEQGRGDMIQFIRYAPLAAALGGKIVVCVVEEMVALMATVEGITQVVDRDGPLPEYDLHIPALSLPHVLGTTLETIPDHVPYLRPDPRKEETWRSLLVADGKFRVGLVWQGSPAHRDDHNRSCELALFLSLGKLEGITLYNLQFGNNADQLLALADQLPIVDYSDQIHDFSDTAALVANLDLVISVDTAVAHLAGALGKPVWTLLPFVPDWRWLLEREDSPWYPTMRLFRQPSPGNWQEVVAIVRHELAGLLKDVKFHAQRGIAKLKSGHAAQAETIFTMAVNLNPDNAEAHCNLGVALDAQHRYLEAISCYRGALLHKPDFLQALFNMGNAYLSLAKQDEARTCYEKSVELKPDFVSGYVSLGEIEKQQRAFDQARANFDKALSLDPESAEAWQGIAEIDQALEEFEQAILAYKKVLSLDAGRPSTWNLLGTAFQSVEQLDQAEACYRQALDLVPDSVIVMNNLGVVLNAQGRLKDSIAVYRHLLQVDHNYAEGHWNLSVALLAAGEYLEGWREYEWRFKKTNPVVSRDFAQPGWDGSSLQDRTILLHGEQGFGDTIQFARYAPLVAKLGGRVIIECQVPALKRLLHSLQGVAEIVIAGEPLPFFDCHLPMMSLPFLFETTLETIPSQSPYLAAESADVEVWQQRLGPATAFRVGLVWFAKQSQVLNRKRSCRLEMFAPLLNIPGVEFYSLQVGPGAEQLAGCGKTAASIKDFTSCIRDFADTAGFIANLDLVITIDTAVAHLAGALGAKTWVVLPYVAEWRWLCQGQDSPWYPTMRLFRQPEAGDWPGLMTSVSEALSECVPNEIKTTIGLPSLPALRVGLAWSGRQDNPLNRKRSCPFAMLVPLLDLPDITFFSLQMDSPDKVDARLIDLTQEIRCFEDTAALMANLDLIISIDTSVAHLAAAMGRPTWVLLSHVADWRWLKNRSDSPWYPGIELFRQPEHGDWESVIKEVAGRLEQLFAKQPREPLKPQAGGFSPSHERLLLEQLLEVKQQAVRLSELSPDAHLDVGATLALLGRENEAAIAFRRVLELDPEHVAGHLNFAYALLAQGKYTEAWKHFEWRLKRIAPGQIPPWPLLQPNSISTHPAGSTLLVHCEQGYGDTIQFARFLPLLAKSGYRVVVSCQPPIAPLVATIKGVCQVVAHGEPLPVCESQILLLSLPYLFTTTLQTLPSVIPYLAPSPELIDQWRIRLNNFSFVQKKH